MVKVGKRIKSREVTTAQLVEFWKQWESRRIMPDMVARFVGEDDVPKGVGWEFMTQKIYPEIESGRLDRVRFNEFLNQPCAAMTRSQVVPVAAIRWAARERRSPLITMEERINSAGLKDNLPDWFYQQMGRQAPIWMWPMHWSSPEIQVEARCFRGKSATEAHATLRRQRKILAGIDLLVATARYWPLRGAHRLVATATVAVSPPAPGGSARFCPQVYADSSGNKVIDLMEMHNPQDIFTSFLAY